MKSRCPGNKPLQVVWVQQQKICFALMLDGPAGRGGGGAGRRAPAPRSRAWLSMPQPWRESAPCPVAPDKRVAQASVLL